MGCGASASQGSPGNSGNPSPGAAPITFSEKHGYNAELSEGKKTATRLPSCFDNAVVMSNRLIEDGEFIEVTLSKAGSSFGSFEAGVTSISPDQMSFPPALGELPGGAWFLWNNSLIDCDNKKESNSFPLYMDTLTPDTRIGMLIKRFRTRSLHFYKNGEDLGEAFNDLPENLYFIFNLHGYVEQISITKSTKL